MSTNSSDFVTINDVGPRDGLQNQPKILSPDERVQLIEALLSAGLKNIEIGSFVSPKAVPAMAGTDKVFSSLPANVAEYSAMIPNVRGYELAVESGVEAVSMVVAASETMNQENVRMPVNQSVAICLDLLDRAKVDNKKMILCIATAWECPFEGKIKPQTIAKIVGQFVEAGATEIVLADTIGAAEPASVRSLLSSLIAEFGADLFACHFHDTRGFGVADVYAAVEAGVRRFDASVGGLGGCPFAPGASGNVATEDVILLLNQMGLETQIDLRALMAASDLAAELTGVVTGGNASTWLQRQISKDTL